VALKNGDRLGLARLPKVPLTPAVAVRMLYLFVTYVPGAKFATTVAPPSVAVPPAPPSATFTRVDVESEGESFTK
jgi:hypothetical protein